MRTYFFLIQNSFKTLSKNKKRTFLTLLGIVVGNGVLVLVLSLGQGLESFIMGQLGAFTPNTIMVEVQTPPSSRAGILGAYDIKTLNEKDKNDLEQIEGIEYASGWFMGTGKMQFEREEKNISLLGVNTHFPMTQNIPIEAGRFFNQTEDLQGEKVVVIGKGLAEDITNEKPFMLQNQKIKINQKSFRVVGITEELDAMGPMSLSDMAFIPVKAGERHIWGDDHLQAIMFRMTDLNQASRISWRMQNILRRNHNIDDPEDDDFAVRTFDQMMEIVSIVINGVNLLLSALAGISLLVGGVGIMNVMYVTVSERTKEIGLRKSLGARPNLILIQFLFEAVLLTSIGGIFGALGGTILSWLISFGARYAGFNWIFSIPWDGIIGAILISSCIGIIFGMSPAKKASQLDPILALRSES